MVADPSSPVPLAATETWAKCADSIAHVDGGVHGIVGVMNVEFRLVLRSAPEYDQIVFDWHTLAAGSSDASCLGFVDYHASKVLRLDQGMIPWPGGGTAAACLSLRSGIISQARSFGGHTWDGLRGIMSNWPPTACLSANAIVCELLFRQNTSICYSAMISKSKSHILGIILGFPSAAQIAAFKRIHADAATSLASSSSQELFLCLTFLLFKSRRLTSERQCSRPHVLLRLQLGLHCVGSHSLSLE